MHPPKTVLLGPFPIKNLNKSEMDQNGPIPYTTFYFSLQQQNTVNQFQSLLINSLIQNYHV